MLSYRVQPVARPVATEFLAVTTRGILSFGLASGLVSVCPVPGWAGAAEGDGARNLAGVSPGTAETKVVDLSGAPAVFGPGEALVQLTSIRASRSKKLACLVRCVWGKPAHGLAGTARFLSSFMVEAT